jgi:hypothetical protein
MAAFGVLILFFFPLKPVSPAKKRPPRKTAAKILAAGCAAEYMLSVAALLQNDPPQGRLGTGLMIQQSIVPDLRSRGKTRHHG